MIPTLVARASEAWPRWFNGESAPHLVATVVGGGPAHGRRALVFLFPRRASRPRVVLKVASSAFEARCLRSEFEALTRLWTVVPTDLQRSIPEPLGKWTEGSASVIAMRALPGKRLLVPDLTAPRTLWGARLLRRFLGRAFSWTVGLARYTAEPAPSDEGLLAEIVDRFAHAYPGRAERLASFRRAVGATSIRWSPCWQHRDITVGNVLDDRGNLRLVDWEHASGRSEPWFDLAYAPGAIALLACSQGSASVVDAARHVLGSDHWVGATLREEMSGAWRQPVPLHIAVALTAMSTALRRQAEGRLGWVDWAELAVALVGQDDLRRRLDWLAPAW